jgi:limonene-1,2-epoxide hydrolase
MLAACGDDSGSDPAQPSDAAAEAVAIDAAEIPGDAEHEDVAVIAAWVDTLREGDVEGAAEYFAIPSIAVNGGLMLRIRSVEDAVAFNESLPCGAELIRAEGEGEIVTATFRLTERPGPGTCGDGTGELAQTAFEIDDGEIVEWRRVGEGAPQTEGQAV